MKFKTERIKKEWGELLFKNPALTHIALDAEWFFKKERPGREITITGIYRTEEEQRALYPNNKTLKSVHQYWRGVDVRTIDMPMVVIGNIKEYLNKKFFYDKKVSTCVYHDIGAGPHLHLQTK